MDGIAEFLEDDDVSGAWGRSGMGRSGSLRECPP
jgi:hypothetical protein